MFHQRFSTNTTPGGSQSIATSGAITITGGRAPSQVPNRNSGIFNNGNGTPTVSADSKANKVSQGSRWGSCAKINRHCAISSSA